MASLVTDDADASTNEIMDEDVVPIDTPCSADVLDVDFSPKNNTYAAALITGIVEIYQYTPGVQAACVATLQHHAQSCRNVRFCPHRNGDLMYTRIARQNCRCDRHIRSHPTRERGQERRLV